MNRNMLFWIAAGVGVYLLMKKASTTSGIGQMDGSFWDFAKRTAADPWSVDAARRTRMMMDAAKGAMAPAQVQRNIGPAVMQQAFSGPRSKSFMLSTDPIRPYNPYFMSQVSPTVQAMISGSYMPVAGRYY